MHPTIPIHTILCPKDFTASCGANLSRERFVPFGQTFILPIVFIRQCSRSSFDGYFRCTWIVWCHKYQHACVTF